MKPFLRTGSLVLASLLLAWAVAGCAGYGAKAPAPLTDAQVQKNMESFDMVWETIRDKHWDPELGGLDWSAARDTLRPKVEAATTQREARGAMGELIDLLGQSHFGIIPASVYDDATGAVKKKDRPKSGAHADIASDGYSGMDIRLVDDQVLVVKVDPGSPAAAAGIVPGWQILKVDDEDLAPIIERLTSALAGRHSVSLIMARAIASRLDGETGEIVAVDLLDGAGAEVRHDLVLSEVPGVPVTTGNLPEVNVWSVTDRLDGDVGYFRFNYFLGIMEIMPAYNAAMADFKDATGIIVDLRGNPGGLGGMAMGMSGWFIQDKGHVLGTMFTRGGPLKFAVNPRLGSFTGPVAVLVDELSASTSEIMAGGLQDLERARIFGRTTAGAALPSVIDKLPNGDGFQYAIANYISHGGVTLEGTGVVPDEEIIPTRDKLLTGVDPAVEAARQWILQQTP